MDSEKNGVAVITGGTSGIGAAYAEAYAKRGFDLMITGRRREKIESVAEQIRQETGANVEVLIVEISNEDELEALVKRVSQIKNLEVLINNAGFAKAGHFHETDLEVHEKMLKVHTQAPMKLSYAALQTMVSNGSGTIINVSSLGGFLPFPRNALYSATKAFLIFLTETLHLELEGTGVKVQVLCPGLTITDFHEKMGADPATLYKDKGWMRVMTAQEVVDISLRYLDKNQPLCVPGPNNNISSIASRVLPRRLTYRMVKAAKLD